MVSGRFALCALPCALCPLLHHSYRESPLIRFVQRLDPPSLLRASFSDDDKDLIGMNRKSGRLFSATLTHHFSSRSATVKSASVKPRELKISAKRLRSPMSRFL